MNDISFHVIAAGSTGESQGRFRNQQDCFPEKGRDFTAADQNVPQSWGGSGQQGNDGWRSEQRAAPRVEEESWEDDDWGPSPTRCSSGGRGNHQGRSSATQETNVFASYRDAPSSFGGSNEWGSTPAVHSDTNEWQNSSSELQRHDADADEWGSSVQDTLVFSSFGRGGRWASGGRSNDNLWNNAARHSSNGDWDDSVAGQGTVDFEPDRGRSSRGRGSFGRGRGHRSDNQDSRRDRDIMPRNRGDSSRIIDVLSSKVGRIIGKCSSGGCIFVQGFICFARCSFRVPKQRVMQSYFTCLSLSQAKVEARSRKFRMKVALAFW